MVRVADGLLAVLIVVTAVLWREMGERTAAVNPWIIDGGSVRLQPLLSWCVGGRAACTAATGAAEIWTPVLVNGTWLLDAAPSGALRISVNGTPLLYVSAAGAVVVGPAEPPLAATGTVVGLVPVAEIVTPMWASHARLAFGNASILDAVCHVADASICGTLLRAGPDDAGTFWSPTRVIVGTPRTPSPRLTPRAGAVPLGLIQASQRSLVLANASLQIVAYTDRGSAVPCCCAPSPAAVPLCPP